MANYAPAFALDKNNYPYTDAPVTSLVAVRNREDGSVSSVVTLTHDTTLIEVAAVGGPAAIRWVRTADAATAATSVITAVAGANFTHIISTNTSRLFAVPKEAMGSSAASIQGANRGEGLFQRVAYKSAAGASSILFTEYGSGGY